LLGAGGVLSGCALPFMGPLVLTDILTGASIISTVTTGKGATEIALDIMIGKDCRLLEGALREDREFCEEQGSPATEEDFKGVTAWLEENEPQGPLQDDLNDGMALVAQMSTRDRYRSFEATPTESASTPILVATTFEPLADQPVALASVTELPEAWIVLASAEFSPEAEGFAAISPASGAPSLVDLMQGDAPLPFLLNGYISYTDMVDIALEKYSVEPSGVIEKSFTLPETNNETPIVTPAEWAEPWPEVRAEILPPQRDVMLRPAPAKALVKADLLAAVAPQLLPAPAKPVIQAFLPHPEKPVQRAALPDSLKNAGVETVSLSPAG
jgi:hypothetical protein